MKPLQTSDTNVIIAKDQPEYIPLPAHYSNGIITTCWSLTWVERVKMFVFGKFYLQIYTGARPLQPLKPSVDNPLLPDPGPTLENAKAS